MVDGATDERRDVRAVARRPDELEAFYREHLPFEEQGGLAL